MKKRKQNKPQKTQIITENHTAETQRTQSPTTTQFLYYFFNPKHETRNSKPQLTTENTEITGKKGSINA